MHTFLECVNDGVTEVIGKNPTDSYGWQYADDAIGDGYGGHAFEIYGMAIRETLDSVWVVLSGGMPLTGTPYAGAADGNIGWGDLFINLSSANFATAIANGDVFGVRFAATNNSGVSQLGVYSHVTAMSVTPENYPPHERLADYLAHYTHATHLHENFYGDLGMDSDYFDRDQSWNAIASGTYRTDIHFLATTDLQEAGYDFNRWQCQGAECHTIAFQFSTSIFRDGSASVPEPATGASLLGLGLVAIAKRYRKFN